MYFFRDAACAKTLQLSVKGSISIENGKSYHLPLKLQVYKAVTYFTINLKYCKTFFISPGLFEYTLGSEHAATVAALNK